MRFSAKKLSLLIVLILAGCATRSDLDYLRGDLEEVRTRLIQTDKELATLRSETRDGIQKNLKGVQNDLNSARKGAADLQATVESMKVDMQVLAGKIDDAALSAKKPSDNLALLKEDTERRFAVLEGRMDTVEKFLDDQKKAAEAKPANPDDLYQQGIDTYKSGDTPKAREILSKFIELYPAHDMAANAHYWLGETYYSEKSYDQAILEFQEVIKKFPGKEKVPAAELKQGMAFKELGDVKSARYLYKKVIENFPTSSEAKIAREKLKTLK